MKNLSLKCPKCGLPARADLKSKFHKFLIYTCPRCRSNVVYYKHKLDVLSDQFVEALLQNGRLKFCGNVLFSNNNFKPTEAQSSRDRAIDTDDITNLKILLETEKDISKIISNL